MQRKIQEDKEDARSVARLVGGPGVLRDATREAGCGDEAPEETHEEHPAARVDAVVEPGAKGVVDDTGGGEPEGGQEERHATCLAEVGVENDGVVVLKEDLGSGGGAWVVDLR